MLKPGMSRHELHPACLSGGAAVLVVAALCFTFILPVHRDAYSTDDNKGFPSEAIENAINASASYLIGATRDDGLFEYRVNANPVVSVKPAYNIVRHAGTLYAMSMYLAEQNDEAMRRAILSAGRYLRDQAIAPLPEGDGLLAVWSKPEVTKKNSPLQAKLGGAGLGLTALTSLERIQAGFTPLADLQGLGRFIVFMQKQDGSFYSKYVPSTGGRDDSRTSLYYPGEAALGLLMLYEMERSDLWFTAASGALIYLARLRKNERVVRTDHWALLATAKMLSLDDVEIAPELRAQLISHADQICEAILAKQINDPESHILDGGFSPKGSVTSTATRLEGLLAARTFLPPETELAQRIDAAVPRGIAFLLRAQIAGGEFAGGFPRAIAPLAPDHPEADRFNRRATEVRIDYVQHALSALIQYRATLPPRS